MINHVFWLDLSLRNGWWLWCRTDIKCVNLHVKIKALKLSSHQNTMCMAQVTVNIMTIINIISPFIQYVNICCSNFSSKSHSNLSVFTGSKILLRSKNSFLSSLLDICKGVYLPNHTCSRVHFHRTLKGTFSAVQWEQMCQGGASNMETASEKAKS